MSQAEHSDEVLDLLELCELERVDMGKSYTVDFRVKKYDIKLNFSWSTDSEKQRAEEEQSNLYFQGVSFYENCTIPLPFGLKKGDTGSVITKKIHENSKILHIFRSSVIDSFLLEDRDKIYFFKIGYTEDDFRKLIDIVAFTWDVDMDLNRNYMKKKISIDEALKG